MSDMIKYKWKGVLAAQCTWCKINEPIFKPNGPIWWHNMDGMGIKCEASNDLHDLVDEVLSVL